MLWRNSNFFSLVWKIRPKAKANHIHAPYDRIVIPLPPYVFDLDSIELNWCQIIDYVGSHNTTAEMSLTRPQDLVQEGIKVLKEELRLEILIGK
jgi:hypothetical protein